MNESNTHKLPSWRAGTMRRWLILSPSRSSRLERRRLFRIVQLLLTIFVIIMSKQSNSNSSNSKVYAVAVGRTTGIYTSWSDCQTQVHGYSRAQFRSFRTRAQAVDYLQRHGISATTSSSTAAAAAAPTRTSSVGVVITRKVDPSNQPEQGKSSNPGTSTTSIGTKRGRADAKNPPDGAAAAAARDKRLRRQSPDVSSWATAAANDDNDDDDIVWSIAIAFDGGSRGNPGIAGAGATVTFRRSSSTGSLPTGTTTSTRNVAEVVLYIRDYVAEAGTTNNQAEYQGLVTALRVAKREWDPKHTHKNQKLVSLTVQGDSQLIIEQMKGVYQCRSDKLQSHYRQAKELLKEFSTYGPVSLRHVYRAENKVADALANEAMDARRSWITTSVDNHEKQYSLHDYLMVMTPDSETTVESVEPINTNRIPSAQNATAKPRRSRKAGGPKAQQSKAKDSEKVEKVLKEVGGSLAILSEHERGAVLKKVCSAFGYKPKPK